ncbi:probable WRKY transcription factor 4 [Arachis duranensis]|uniref:Probable WRKY transcription factor 4 n=1 Tax=Arachis duranensis TaxID=130453 RepID=A0A9C6TWV3_ARADU|nr:probable WRKY transcription factor 4 [Arachis duranensis]
MAQCGLFCRSYYRCTTIGCNAKKKVERCLNDPTHALTTYEGFHTHDLPPILPPPSRSFGLYNNSTLSSILGRGRGIQKGVASDAGAGARARYHANNTITSVNGRIDSGSSVNDIGSLENIGCYSRHHSSRCHHATSQSRSRAASEREGDAEREGSGSRTAAPSSPFCHGLHRYLWGSACRRHPWRTAAATIELLQPAADRGVRR